MDTKDPVVNNGRETQVVKDFAAVSPDIGRAKLLKALVIESVYFGDLSRLVVASDECNSVWVSDLQKTTRKCQYKLGYESIKSKGANRLTFRASRSKKVSTL